MLAIMSGGHRLTKYLWQYHELSTDESDSPINKAKTDTEMQEFRYNHSIHILQDLHLLIVASNSPGTEDNTNNGSWINPNESCPTVEIKNLLGKARSKKCIKECTKMTNVSQYEYLQDKFRTEFCYTKLIGLKICCHTDIPLICQNDISQADAKPVTLYDIRGNVCTYTQ
eukprot:11792215-Ditylum_brightwellii.AAC.1